MNIRPTRLLAAISMALALAACQKLGNLSATSDKTPDLAIGATATGEITSSSPLNHNDGSRHQDYRITMKSGEAVSLELGGSLSGQLAVFDGSNLIAKANTGYYGMEGEGEVTTSGSAGLAFRAPKDGTYLIAVNSIGADSFGPFKLKALQVVPYDGKPLAAGSETTDWLIGEKQEYKLKIDKAGLYSITMESSAFDGYLRLNGRNVELEDDDNGGSLNPRIRTWLEPGDYTLAASAMNGNSGAFKLNIVLTPVSGNLATRDGTTLTIGQTAQGLIDASGSRSFVLNLDEARRIQFDAIAEDFDSKLRISGPGVEAEDDDGGNGLNARLLLPLGPGRYIIEVSSLSGSQGMFELETSQLGGNVSSPANGNRKGEDADADAAVEAN